MTSTENTGESQAARGSGGELPAQIGPYRIEGLLGEGGMGRVYLAVQEEPHRQVALKVIRAAASGEFRLRFRLEGELLAGLAHPGIARIYATGTADTPGGALPYLAMEFIHGADLLRHAQQHHLNLRAKLRLVAEICRAVHYAHTRGVVHRDLKPGNILVDEQGCAKILDFGVARMMGDEALTRMTAAGEIVGTLPYMSWEQLTGEGPRADPRADVYSLGVIAYELISGQLPYPGLDTATLLSAVQRLRKTEPLRLSKAAPAAAGDAETLVMKALAREPEARYGSAAEMAADIERYLAQLPIAARPPTARYVIGLFVRRHRALTAGAALVLAVIVAAAVISLRYGLAEAEARREAEARSAESTAINRFLDQMLTAADPQHTRGEQLTVRELLDNARSTLTRDTALLPAAAGALRLTMAETYRNLGLLEPTLQLSAEVIALPGADPGAVLRARVTHAMALSFSGKIDEAYQEMQTVLPLLPPAQGEAQRQRVATLNAYAVILLEQGKLTEGESLLRTLLTEAEASLPRDADETLDTAQNLAAVFRALGKLDQALPLQEDLARRYSAKLGGDHPASLQARAGLSMMYRDRADPRAEASVRAVYADRLRLLGADHPDSLQSQATLITVLLLDTRFRDAESLAQEHLARNLALRGPDHLDSLLAKNLLGDALLGLGRGAAAEALFRQVQEAGAAGTAHPLTLSDGLARALMEQGRLDAAAAEFDTLLTRTRQQLPPDHPKLMRFMSASGECALRRSQPAAARALLEPAHSALLAKLGRTHPYTVAAAQRLRQTYLALGLKAEAEALGGASTP